MVTPPRLVLLAHAASTAADAVATRDTYREMRAVMASSSMVNVDPPLLLVARQHCLDDADFRVAILERREVRRVLSRRLPRGDVPIEVAEEIARSVGIALRMAARIVREGTRHGVHQRRILHQRLVRLVAVADPQMVRVLLVPRQRAPAPVHLDPLPVLAPRAHLRDDERS